MGLWMSRLLSLFGDREARILVLGLDNAGKTTILCAWGVGRERERVGESGALTERGGQRFFFFHSDTAALRRFRSLSHTFLHPFTHTHTQTACRSARWSAPSPVS